MAKEKKGKRGSVKVQDMDAKKNPKGGNPKSANKMGYLKIKMEDVIITSVAPHKIK